MAGSRIDSPLFAQTAAVARADGTEHYFNTHRYRFETILRALPPAPRTVLEVGTAPGYFTRLLVGSGYTVSGVDLAPERRAALWDELGVEVRRANLDQDPIPYPDQSFDHVVFCEVIEHLLFSPVPTLREIYRVLKPGGSLVLTTPNDRFVASRLRLFARMLLWQSTEPQDEFQRKMNLQGLSHYQTHARTYTMDELVWVIGKVGFQIAAHEHRVVWERVGMEQLTLRGQPLRYLAKHGVLKLTQAIPPLRSMLLVVAERPTGERMTTV